MSATYPLLRDLSHVPTGYVRGVADAKRFLERWSMDPGFREGFAADHDGALAQLGLSITTGDALRLIDPEDKGRILRACLECTDPGDDVVSHYWSFYLEKVAHRDNLVATAVPGNVQMAAWHRRQVERVRAEVGAVHARNIVHAPFAVELSKGCSVGCWFCGLAAPPFDSFLPYTQENAELWAGCLDVLGEVIGAGAENGFLYWASDPLDNPEYERYITAFHERLGSWPQTTTAQAWKDPERTQRFLHEAYSRGSAVDRFSILSLGQLKAIHRDFSPIEMLRVELVPQNRGSSTIKSRSGRARTVDDSRAREVADSEHASTIACVTGFIVNMVDREVRMVTPCNSSDRWPLGYWVLGEGSFDTPAELKNLLEDLIARHAQPRLALGDRVALHKDITATCDESGIVLDWPRAHTSLRVSTHPEHLLDLLTAGTWTAADIALARESAASVPLESTLALLDELDANGVLDEEPAPYDFSRIARMGSKRASVGQR